MDLNGHLENSAECVNCYTGTANPSKDFTEMSNRCVYCKICFLYLSITTLLYCFARKR
jgi:hypothetical protein